VILQRCNDFKDYVSSGQTTALLEGKLGEMVHGLPEVNNIITLRQNLVVRSKTKNKEEKEEKTVVNGII